MNCLHFGGIPANKSSLTETYVTRSVRYLKQMLLFLFVNRDVR